MLKLSINCFSYFLGSSLSSLLGYPVAILQKVHFLVQTLPNIINVACFLFQHSPILGHAASSQTVFKSRDFIILLVFEMHLTVVL